MIIVTSTLTADNADVLNGTDLQNVPELGQLDIYAASTQNDTELTITGPGQAPVVRARRLQLRTNGQPSLQDDLPFSIPVLVGGKYFVDINIVTAATVVVIAVYRDLQDLGLA